MLMSLIPAPSKAVGWGVLETRADNAHMFGRTACVKIYKIIDTYIYIEI